MMRDDDPHVAVRVCPTCGGLARLDGDAPPEGTPRYRPVLDPVAWYQEMARIEAAVRDPQPGARRDAWRLALRWPLLLLLPPESHTTTRALIAFGGRFAASLAVFALAGYLIAGRDGLLVAASLAWLPAYVHWLLVRWVFGASEPVRLALWLPWVVPVLMLWWVLR